MTDATRGEHRMLIDGKLVDAKSGKTFDNVNPATEEVLGQVADAGHDDMDGPSAAPGGPSTRPTGRPTRRSASAASRQLQARPRGGREELLRAELVAEVGSPVAADLRAPARRSAGRRPAAGRPSYIDEFPWERDLPEGTAVRRAQLAPGVAKEPVGVVGAIVPWNYPFEVTINKLGQSPGHRQHRDPQAGPGHARGTPPASAGSSPSAPTSRRASSTSSPPRTTSVGEELVTDPRVDLISFTGSTAVGQRIMEKGAPTLKRLFLELGGKSADIVLDDADFDADAVDGLDGLHPRRPGLRHARPGCSSPAPATTRASRSSRRASRTVPYGDPHRSRPTSRAR